MDTQKIYHEMGISSAVLAFCCSAEEKLKPRFAAIDAIAEYNQAKVVAAMQKNRVSAECFAASTGYGYNDIGREALEKVYADTFHTEAALVRPQITCGTHALALALAANLRPGDELLLSGRPSLRYSRGSHRHPPLQGLPGRVRHHLPGDRTAAGWHLRL